MAMRIIKVGELSSVHITEADAEKLGFVPHLDHWTPTVCPFDTGWFVEVGVGFDYDLTKPTDPNTVLAEEYNQRLNDFWIAQGYSLPFVRAVTEAQQAGFHHLRIHADAVPDPMLRQFDW